MLYEAITRIDTLRVMRGAGWIMGSVIACAMALTVAMWIEPTNPEGTRHLQVRHIESPQIGPRSPFVQLKAHVVLPNGNDSPFMVYPKLLSAEQTVCAKITLGRWTDTYHVKILPLSQCR